MRWESLAVCSALWCQAPLYLSILKNSTFYEYSIISLKIRIFFLDYPPECQTSSRLSRCSISFGSLHKKVSWWLDHYLSEPVEATEYWVCTKVLNSKFFWNKHTDTGTQNRRLLNKPYENEVTLTGQNPPFNYCLHFELFTAFLRELDLSMLEIWGL